MRKRRVSRLTFNGWAVVVLACVIVCGAALIGWHVIGQQRFTFTPEQLRGEMLMQSILQNDANVNNLQLRIENNRVVIDADVVDPAHKARGHVQLRGEPNYGALRGSFYIPLFMGEREYDISSFEIAGSGSILNAGTEKRAVRALVAAADRAFERVSLANLEPDARLRWYNHAAVQGDVIVVEYSTVQTTYHVILGVTLIIMAIMGLCLLWRFPFIVDILFWWMIFN